MLCVGLDVHTNRSSFCILNEDGKIVKQELVHGRWPQVVDQLRQIPEPISVCYEASCGYGNIYDRLAPVAAAVTVAHPGALRLIFKSKKKHDRIDAQRLAKLLYLDEVPGVHVPGIDVRAWRKLIEYRQKLLGRRVGCKNQVRAIVRAQGVSAPRGLWGRKGIAWLKELDLPDGEKLTLEMTLEELAEYATRIKRVEKELSAIASRHPEVALLMTIPGVGIRTAESYCAYVDDIKRFSSSRKVGSYFGLVPCLDSSAGKDRLGHITRQGPPTVRKMLCESGWMGIGHNPTLRAFYQRVMNGDPDRKKIALVATSHYLCRIMAAMLRTGEVWRGPEKKQGRRSTAGGGEASPPRKTPDA